MCRASERGSWLVGKNDYCSARDGDGGCEKRALSGAGLSGRSVTIAKRGFGNDGGRCIQRKS